MSIYNYIISKNIIDYKAIISCTDTDMTRYLQITILPPAYPVLFVSFLAAFLHHPFVDIVNASFFKSIR